MIVEPNFNIDFHKQLIQYSLDYAYKNEFVDFETIKKRVAPIRFQNKELKEEDIHYIFDLLVGQGYLMNHWDGSNRYLITQKGRIFYLITYW